MNIKINENNKIVKKDLEINKKILNISLNKELTVLDIIEAVKEQITPLYEKSKKSFYTYIINSKELRNEDFPKWKENLYSGMYTKEVQSLMDWGNDVIEEKVDKKYNKVIENVAKTVENKLQDLKISSIELDKNGILDFEFLIKDTENNRYRFTINTILAGGYNVQVLHYRTTYKLKQIKN
jgi:hypothetical protein